MSDLRIGVLTCSNESAIGDAVDSAGRAIIEQSEAAGWLVVAYHVCVEDRECIAASLMEMADVEEADVVFTCGGIGLGSLDVTPEATWDVCERDIPGIADHIRERSSAPDAILTRGVSAQRGCTIVINLPGAEGSVREAFTLVADKLEGAAAAVRCERSA